MTDYERGVEQATFLYKEVIREYVAENDKLLEACAELLKMAESHDPEWLHWPEVHEELRQLGVEV